MKNPFKKSPKKDRKRENNITNQRSAAYSYYRSQSNTDKVKSASQTRKPLLHKIMTIFAMAGVLLFVVYLTTLTNDPDIQFQDKNALGISSEEDYKNTIQEYSNTSIFNKSKLSFDALGLRNKLRSEFPEIESAQVQIPVVGRNIVVEIEPRKPKFLLRSQEGTAIIGQNGIVLQRDDNSASTIENNDIDLLTIEDTSRIRIEQGRPVLPSQSALFFSIVNEQLIAGDLRPTKFVISSSPYDIEIQFQDKKYTARFNVLEGAKQQSGALLAFLSNREEKGLPMPRTYIDVRVPERVYYK